MKKSKFSEEQIATAWRKVEGAAPVAEVTRKLGEVSRGLSDKCEAVL